MVLRLRGGGGGSSIRPCRSLDHTQRTPVLSAPRAFGRRACARVKAWSSRSPAGDASHFARAWTGSSSNSSPCEKEAERRMGSGRLVLLPRLRQPEDIEAAARPPCKSRTDGTRAGTPIPLSLAGIRKMASKHLATRCQVPASDLETMRQPLDFYGFNSYTGVPTQAGPDGSPVHPKLPAGHGHTLFLWKVTPEILHWGPKFLWPSVTNSRSSLPKTACRIPIGSRWTGSVHDGPRIDYLQRHLRALHKAINEGVRCRGYFHWSFIDNFEWAEGYKHRFGLIHATLRRRSGH